MVFRWLMTSHNPGLDTYNADAAAVGPIRRGEPVPVVAGEPVRVEFALEADDG